MSSSSYTSGLIVAGILVWYVIVEGGTMHEEETGTEYVM
jgi:hypothetical protein